MHNATLVTMLQAERRRYREVWSVEDEVGRIVKIIQACLDAIRARGWPGP